MNYLEPLENIQADGDHATRASGRVLENADRAADWYDASSHADARRDRQPAAAWTDAPPGDLVLILGSASSGMRPVDPPPAPAHTVVSVIGQRRGARPLRLRVRWLCHEP